MHVLLSPNKRATLGHFSITITFLKHETKSFPSLELVKSSKQTGHSDPEHCLPLPVLGLKACSTIPG